MLLVTQKELKLELENLRRELDAVRERVAKLESQKKTKTLVTSLGPRTIKV